VLLQFVMCCCAALLVPATPGTCDTRFAMRVELVLVFNAANLLDASAEICRPKGLVPRVGCRWRKLPSGRSNRLGKEK